MNHTARRGGALSLALLPLALLAACTRPTPPPAEPPRPVRSIVATVTDGSVGATYAGVVQARYESKLGFQTSGKVVARLVEVGSRVKRGQLLMRLDPEQLVLQLSSSSASVEADRTRVEQARIDLQRSEQLHAKSFASQAEVDAQKLALAEAESQLKSSLARRAIDANQRGYTELRADRDGVVSAINAETGQVVSAGQAVVTVAADGEREVVVSIPESRVDELRRAKTLRVSLWARQGRTFAGTLRELAPDSDKVSRTYSARIAVRDADAELMLGMTASVVAPDVDGTRAIRVPLTAIHDADGKAQVWLVDERTKQVSARPVTLGAAHDDSVIVTGGLAGGETVVTAGVHMLHAGQQVKTLDAAVAAGGGADKVAARSRP